MSEKTELVVNRLVESFPGLRPVLAVHLDDNFGELLPHVLFGDIVRWLVDEASNEPRIRSASPRQIVQTFLNEVEDIFASGDSEVQELVAVSFLENLPDPNERGGELRSKLGPFLRRELKNLRL